ncbi:MAG: hypothetical protein GY782_07085, partial [Gammaproteobacteria bacterium]|nr:hypothetical protein [Gammaproteobacteria bacterium]
KDKTTPNRFYIDLGRGYNPRKIYSDKKGLPLDSYGRAKDALKMINYDIENKTYDSSDWKKSSGEKYYFLNKWNEFKKLKEHKSFKYKEQIKYAEKYIIKHFSASQDIREIQQSDIHLFVHELDNYQKEMHPKKEPETGKYKKSIIEPLLSCLNYYRKIGLIKNESNFMSPEIEIKKKRKDKSNFEDSLKVISLIRENIRDDYIIYLFLITHGCRLGEARALKIKQISFRGNHPI